jgi:hypothetical protein
MRRKAKAQWADPEQRQRIHEGLTAAHDARKGRYADLTEEKFTLAKADGRRYAKYWDDASASYRYAYRYRWRWEQANGPIPEGMEIHHRNEDCSDDRLENLELKPPEEHRKHHMSSERARAMRKMHRPRPLKGQSGV